jgi:hypothetical protein
MLLELIQQTLRPRLSLKKTIRRWADVSWQLREAPRRRQLQLERLEEIHASLF